MRGWGFASASEGRNNKSLGSLKVSRGKGDPEDTSHKRFTRPERAENGAKILAFYQANPLASTKKAALELGLTRSTVQRYRQELIEEGLVEPIPRGRRPG